MENKKKSDLSVILRTRNEEKWIGHAIQSILDNIYKPEIIIIDNARANIFTARLFFLGSLYFFSIFFLIYSFEFFLNS